MKKLATLFLLLFVSVKLSAQVGFTDAFPSLPNFSFPIEMVHAGDGTNRLFVVEKAGRIRVFQNQSGASSYATFLDITDRVVLTNPPNSDERGLLGLAFHPNYATNRLFYVYYTRDTVISGNTRMKMILSRFEANPSNPNEALPNSEYRLLQFAKNQNNTNHNGGKIAFGTDGFLYASIGDGGGGGDPQNNGQNVNNLFGKILRIDISGDDFPANNDRNYRIPATNPFASGGGSPEIFAWGIRNMWKFSVDNVEGIIGGDVGQNAREEIDRVQVGRNYGWRFMEGNIPYNIPNPSDTNGLNLAPPIHVYPHSDSRSVTGGYVYRGSVLPEQVGRYIYGDFVSGRVWSLNLATSANVQLFASGVNISSFAVDQNNELYFLGFGDGRVYRFTNTAPPPPGDAVAGIGVWSALGGGVNGAARAVAAQGNSVFVGGSFTTAGGSAANNIAQWTPQGGWTALGGGIAGTVNAITIDQNGDVLVGGAFTTAGGVSAANIARWNGSTWSALGAGTNGYVSAIVVASNGDVLVGGAFTTAGSVTANNIARWNGSTWSDLAGGMNNEVRALAFNASGDLFAGGNFTLAGGVSAANIARWNGSSWNALGAGVDAFVNALTVLQSGDVIAGGIFLNASGSPASRIARWNGSSWNTLGAGASGLVSALTSVGNTVYAGGGFVAAQGRIVNQVARWNGASWDALGHGAVGANGNVNALAISGRTVFAGGSATTFGDVAANNIARLELPDAAEVRAVSAGGSSQLFAQTGVSIDFTGVASNGSVSVSRYDDAPQNPVGVVGNVSRYRFIIDQVGLGSFNATLRFNRTQIPNSGILSPQTARVYRRPTPGAGTFSLLTNAFDSGNPDEVRATTTAFSEFVLGGDSDNPLPVELSAFTGAASTNGVELRWTTASERNNAGFVVLRDGLEIASYRFAPELRGRGTTASATNYRFLDGNVESGKTYAYKLRSFDLDGTAHDYAQTVSVETREPVQSRVYEYALMQNYPNPFNPTTIIPFTMKAAGAATITVYDVLGRAVSQQTLQARAGENQYRLDGGNLGSGVYFYTLQAGNFTRTMKMTLIK